MPRKPKPEIKAKPDASPPKVPWFSPAPDRSGELDIPDRDFPPRCGAKLREKGKFCRKRPLNNAARCRLHGGYLSNRPRNTASKVQAERSQFVHISQVQAMVVGAEELLTHEGRRKAAAVSTARVAKRLESIPETLEYADLAFKGEDGLRKGIALGHELEKKDAPAAAAPVFQIANFGDSSNGVVQARSAEGAVTIQFVNGKPYMLEERTGILYPAVAGKDADTGAEIYSRLLSEG